MGLILLWTDRARRYKTFHMFINSAEHAILNVRNYENVKKFSIFSGSEKLRMLFFLLISVKMPILTFMSRKNHAQLS